MKKVAVLFSSALSHPLLPFPSPTCPVSSPLSGTVTSPPNMWVTWVCVWRRFRPALCVCVCFSLILCVLLCVCTHCVYLCALCVCVCVFSLAMGTLRPFSRWKVWVGGGVEGCVFVLQLPAVDCNSSSRHLMAAVCSTHPPAMLVGNPPRFCEMQIVAIVH